VGRNGSTGGVSDAREGGGPASASASRRGEQLKGEAEHERAVLAERLEEFADPLRDRLRKPVSRVNHWWKSVSNLRPYRVWNQFSHNDGNLRTAGMAYQSLFAVFAALWVAFSVAGAWLTSSPNVMASLIHIINDAVPGLIQTSSSPSGVISEDQLTSLTLTFGWTGVVALGGLVWTAIAWLYYTRQAVRAMFGLPRDSRNYWLQKVSDLGLGFLFGLLLVTSATVSVVTTEALGAFLALFGIPPGSTGTTLLYYVIGFSISVALNFVVLAAMFRLLSRVAIPWRSLWLGSLLGSAALSALSALSGLIIGGASRNPLLTTFVVFVGLLLWFNFICRVILLAAAWIAVGMFDRGLDPRQRTPEQAAYEKALAERSARLLVSQTAVEQAERHADSVRGFRKWFANRQLRDAREELERVEAEPIPRPPKKRSWWNEEDDPAGESDGPGAPEAGPTKGVGGRR
jgi:membrane protein